MKQNKLIVEDLNRILEIMGVQKTVDETILNEAVLADEVGKILDVLGVNAERALEVSPGKVSSRLEPLIDRSLLRTSSGEGEALIKSLEKDATKINSFLSTYSEINPRFAENYAKKYINEFINQMKGKVPNWSKFESKFGKTMRDNMELEYNRTIGRAPGRGQSLGNQPSSGAPSGGKSSKVNITVDDAINTLREDKNFAYLYKKYGGEIDKITSEVKSEISKLSADNVEFGDVLLRVEEKLKQLAEDFPKQFGDMTWWEKYKTAHKNAFKPVYKPVRNLQTGKVEYVPASFKTVGKIAGGVTGISAEIVTIFAILQYVYRVVNLTLHTDDTFITNVVNAWAQTSYNLALQLAETGVKKMSENPKITGDEPKDKEETPKTEEQKKQEVKDEVYDFLLKEKKYSPEELSTWTLTYVDENTVSYDAGENKEDVRPDGSFGRFSGTITRFSKTKPWVLN